MFFSLFHLKFSINENRQLFWSHSLFEIIVQHICNDSNNVIGILLFNL